MNWLTNHKREFAFGVPPKNGCNSIRTALAATSQFPPLRTKPGDCKQRVFVVRHPVDRFLSLWRNKCRDAERGLGIHNLSQVELFEHIKKAPPDDHWTRQVDLLGDVSAIIVRLESMNAWWQEHMGGEYPHDHATDGRSDISAALHALVLNHYADDVRLYANADY